MVKHPAYNRQSLLIRERFGFESRWDYQFLERIYIMKILKKVLGNTYGGPSISYEDGVWVLYSWYDAPIKIEIHCTHMNWDKFIELCKDYEKTLVDEYSDFLDKDNSNENPIIIDNE